MKRALVTGATSGIGLEITKALVENGYFVYGLGRDFRNTYPKENFEPIQADLRNIDEITAIIKKIRNSVDIVINSAGVGYFGLHEELSPQKIKEILDVDLYAPMVIISLMLRSLKKNGGRIINISSAEAKRPSPHGAVYGAAKAALSDFSESIFAEGRKYGVFVTVIHPDITRTDFYKNAPFECCESNEFALSPKAIADAVIYALSADYPIRDITLMPQKQRIQYKKNNNSQNESRGR